MSATPLSRTDGTPAPGNSPGDRNAPGRPLIAATRDPALLAALEELAGDIPIMVVDDIQQLSEEMLQQGASLALLDAAVLDAPLDAVVDALVAQFPDLRLMVAGQAAEQGMLASRIADATVFRFVHKPASALRLRTFLEAAAREGGRRREPVASPGAPARPPSKMAFVVAGLVAAAVAIVAAWLFWPHGAAARLNARDLARVQDMLAQAGTAMAAKRYVSFDGSSAAEMYRDVLALDDRNEQARLGMDGAIKGAIAAALQSLADGKLDDATNLMEAARQVDPGHAGLAELIAQVDAETRRQLEDARARTAILERQAQIRAAVEKVQASIRAGALLEPPTDNAVTQFQAAQALSPGDAAVRAARSELTAAIVEQGEQLVAAHRLSDARRYAAAAGRINSSAVGLSALQRHIEEAAAPPPAATRRAPAPAPVAEAEPAPAPVPAPAPSAATPGPAPPAAIAPATTSAPVTPPVTPPVQPVVAAPPAATAVPAPAAVAPSTATAPEVAGKSEARAATSSGKPAAEAKWIPGEGVIGAAKLKVVRTGSADYPAEARSSQLSGWVEMEFTVARNGSVRDVEVTASEPGRTFDAAAMSAMRGYRFAPVLKDGQPVEQRAKMRIRFVYKDQ